MFLLYRWSPQGSYLATVHGRGIAIWGGPQFQKVARFNHPGVQFIDFSPCEKYLVTFSPNVPRNTEDISPVIIWEARTGNIEQIFNCKLLKNDDILSICDFSDQNHGLIFSEMLVPNLAHFTFNLEHFFHIFNLFFRSQKTWFQC